MIVDIYERENRLFCFEDDGTSEVKNWMRRDCRVKAVSGSLGGKIYALKYRLIVGRQLTEGKRDVRDESGTGPSREP
jgi:hypothetical protein